MEQAGRQAPLAEETRELAEKKKATEELAKQAAPNELDEPTDTKQEEVEVTE